MYNIPRLLCAYTRAYALIQTDMSERTSRGETQSKRKKQKWRIRGINNYTFFLFFLYFVVLGFWFYYFFSPRFGFSTRVGHLVQFYFNFFLLFSVRLHLCMYKMIYSGPSALIFLSRIVTLFKLKILFSATTCFFICGIILHYRPHPSLPPSHILEREREREREIEGERER